MMIHSRIESPSVRPWRYKHIVAPWYVQRSMKSTPDRETLSPSSPSHRVWIWQFLGIGIVWKGVFLCAERCETGSGFQAPPPPQRHPLYTQLRGECPLAEGGGGGLCPYKNATNARITYFRLTSTLRTLYEHREAFVWTPYESSLERRSYERRKGPARTTWGILTITVGILGFWNCLLTVNNLA